MKKLELLKIMNTEQLLTIVEKQELEIKSLETSQQNTIELVSSLNEEIRSLESQLKKSETMKRHFKRMSNKRLDALESIASQFNRSKGCTKADEIINLKAQGNIFDRVNDVFETDSNQNFIQNLTERIL